MKSQYILLMTGCINPNGMIHTALQNADVRKKQYEEALDFYLHRTNCPILFIENTETYIGSSYQKEIDEGRLEFLTFEGNSFDKSLGKGYGEGVIINYAFNHSVMLKNTKWGG